MAVYKLCDVKNALDHPLDDEVNSIGRAETCSIRLLSSSVSRQHGQFTVSDQQLRYQDLGSSNGSFINGNRVDGEQILAAGDTLVIGDFEFNIAADEDDTTTPQIDDDATQLADFTPASIAPEAVAPTKENEIPAMWSENAGLEQASGTEFFSEDSGSDAAQAYREGRLQLPTIANQARLVGLNLGITAKIYELGGDANEPTSERVWKIGRDQDSVDICIAESSVSGMHAQLVNEQSRWKIVNWMSTNGTFVNEQKGLSTYLKSGDIIRIGSAELAFELPENSVEKPVSQQSNVATAPAKKSFWQRLFGR